MKTEYPAEGFPMKFSWQEGEKVIGNYYLTNKQN